MRSGNLALVVGTGRSMWEDFYLSPRAATVFAVNHAALFLPRVEHAVSANGAFIGGIAKARLSLPRYSKDALVVHASTPAPGVTMVWDERIFPWSGEGGTSSLLAVRIAIKLGFTQILVAGVPLDTRGHFYDPEDYLYATDFSAALADWVTVRDENPQIEIRSWSGYTRALLGAPEVG